MTTITRPETVAERQLRQARVQFEAETSTHQMYVEMDESPDRPYRHIRFSQPGTRIWTWSLVTWPGCLAISGDLESFTFRRLHDMFDFFRSPINPGYWAEKIIAGQPRTRFCPERFVEAVSDHVEDQRDWLSPDDFEALKRDVQKQLLDDPPEYLEQAHEWLADYTFDNFEFCDTWEWDLGGWDHHFLISLHAIHYGVKTYLAKHPGRLIPEA